MDNEKVLFTKAGALSRLGEYRALLKISLAGIHLDAASQNSLYSGDAGLLKCDLELAWSKVGSHYDDSKWTSTTCQWHAFPVHSKHDQIELLDPALRDPE